MDEEMKNELLQIIENEDADALKEYISTREPIDFAQEIQDFDDEDLKRLTDLMEDDDLAALMEESDDRMRIRIAHTLENARLLIAFNYMQKDDIVDMLGDFPIGRRKQVINMMKSGEQQVINKLLQYPEDSAGGLMSTGYVALKEDMMISQGLEKIREIGPKTEVIETIYVINGKRQLVGSVDLRNLLSAPKNVLISSIMEENVISVEPETDQAEAAHLVSKYDLNSIPVVSKSKQILGIITVDDVIDVIVEEYDADMLQMAGVSKEENINTTLIESIKMRLPWLLVNLVTAFLAAYTIKLFENTIAKVVALSAVMTIISGMGGNAGTQTMSILVRELALGDISFSRSLKPLLKEILLGVLNGAATGAVTAAIVWPLYGNFYLGLIAFMAMIGNLVIAGLFGFLVPLTLKKCHADPAVASSIFVTTATDTLGFFIFLGLAQLFITRLM